MSVYRTIGPLVFFWFGLVWFGFVNISHPMACAELQENKYLTVPNCIYLTVYVGRSLILVICLITFPVD